MSGRKLLFNKKELHWECSCSVWHEEMVMGAEIDKYINPWMGTILTGFSDLNSMEQSLSDYNNRQLRYDEDAVPAISGLLSVASRSFLGGFLYGLLEMFFDRALGWRPSARDVVFRRRTASQRPLDSRITPSELPSWSWIGWQGLLTTGYDEAVRINNRWGSIEETFPITEWYTAGSPTATVSERRRIKSTWFTDRESYKDLNKPLPPGWTCHEVSTQVNFHKDPFLYPDGCGEWIFKHEAFSDPENNLDSWYYPFPVADITESTPPFMPEQTAYLFCETQRARLWARKSNDPNEQKTNLQLLNSAKEQVGNLHLHNELQLTGFPDAMEEDESCGGVPLGKQVELVAIYRTKTYSKTWNKWRYVLPIRTSESITVLWVEWVDGLAYRLASGKVRREAWDSLAQERISLIMA